MRSDARCSDRPVPMLAASSWFSKGLVSGSMPERMITGRPRIEARRFFWSSTSQPEQSGKTISSKTRSSPPCSIFSSASCPSAAVSMRKSGFQVVRIRRSRARGESPRKGGTPVTHS